MYMYAALSFHTCRVFVFSWTGKRFCNEFKQPLFSKLLSWEPFLMLVKLQVKACLELEDRAFKIRNDNSTGLTGATSSIVSWNFLV